MGTQDTPLLGVTCGSESLEQLLEKDRWEAVKQLLGTTNPANVLRPQSSDPSADTATFLHVAARCGAENCLRVLLETRPFKQELETPDDKGQTALLTAVVNAQPAALKQLIHAGANVNARDNKHLGALHLLVRQLSKDSTVEPCRFLEVADVLFSPQHVSKLDLEPHVKMPYIPATPLAVAAARLQQEDGASWGPSLLELCKKLVRVGASLSDDTGGTTVEQVLRQKGCPLVERQQPPARPTAARVVDVVSMNGSGDEVREVLKEIPVEEAREAVNSSLGSKSLLLHAVTYENLSLVEVLMQYGATPTGSLGKGELPLHRAAANCNIDIFNLLIEKMRGSDGTVDLREHTTILIRKLMESSHSKTGQAAQQDGDHMVCFRRLLQGDITLDLNQKDKHQTALQVVADFNNQEAVSEVLQAGGFLGAHEVLYDKDYGTVLERVLPASLEHAMDGCITHHPKDGSHNKEEGEYYKLYLDYRFLVPPQQGDTKSAPEPVNEMETLMELCCNEKHRHTIKHPLVQTLLRAKWREARLFYGINVLFYLLFVVMLTFFICFLNDLRMAQARPSTHNLEDSLAKKDSIVWGFRIVVLLLCLLVLAREVFQFMNSKPSYLYYFKNADNWLELILLMLVGLLCIVPLDADWTKHLAAWTMIVAWYDLLLVLGRASPFIVYITMLRHVTRNFLKLIPLFIILIISFTISFHIILQPSEDDKAHTSSSSNDTESNQFSNFWTTLPKVIVMSTGEFEFENLSLSEKFHQTIFKISTLLLFLVFLFVIILVLMNTMNALAVTDVQEVIENRKVNDVASLIGLIYQVEKLFLYCPRLCSSICRLQLLCGPDNAPSLIARINPKNPPSLESGSEHKITHTLDEETAHCLRTHLQEKETRQLGAVVQELAQQHPEALRSLAAALRVF